MIIPWVVKLYALRLYDIEVLYRCGRFWLGGLKMSHSIASEDGPVQLKVLEHGCLVSTGREVWSSATAPWMG